MKPTPEDFKDKLAGKLCKPSACDVIKNMITMQGLSCKIHRLKLAKGRKIYFIIENPDLDLDTASLLRKESIGHIREFFPDAHITSAGSSTWTIAEY